jgi:hypothetical protein
MAQPHGYITVNWIDDILELYSFGPFNDEGMALSYTEMQSKANTRIHELTTWQRLDILSEEALGGPSVMREMGQSYLWCFDHGCNAIATVCSTQLQHSILLNFVKKTQANLKGFDTKQAALLWLQSQNSA